MSAANRQRRYRERERAGRIVLQVEVDEFGLTAALVTAGFLPPENHDRDALAAALEHVIQLWEKSVTRDLQSMF